MELNDLINEMITAKGYKSFLLIGTDKNILDSVKCEAKQMVEHDFLKGSKQKFDLILIDGIHTAEQVQEDILNSWKASTAKGAILIHDVKPHDEKMQRVPREQMIWTGDVWRAWHGFRQLNGNIRVAYYDEKYGLGVIYKSRAKVNPDFISSIPFSEYFNKQLWQVR